MPHWNPRLNPALDRALPADIVPGSWRDGEHEIREALFGDGEWRTVATLAWMRDRRGRDVAQVEWHADGGTYTEMYVADPERMREVADEGD